MSARLFIHPKTPIVRYGEIVERGYRLKGRITMSGRHIVEAIAEPFNIVGMRAQIERAVRNLK